MREQSFRCHRPCRERLEDPSSPSVLWLGPPEEHRQRIQELCKRIEAELAAEEEAKQQSNRKVSLQDSQPPVRTWKAWTEAEIVWLELLWQERHRGEKQNTFATRASDLLDRSADSVTYKLKQLGLCHGPKRKRHKAMD